jgi:hypothetical protein
MMRKLAFIIFLCFNIILNIIFFISQSYILISSDALGIIYGVFDFLIYCIFLLISSLLISMSSILPLRNSKMKLHNKNLAFFNIITIYLFLNYINQFNIRIY